MAVSMKNYLLTGIMSMTFIVSAAHADEKSPIQSIYACADITDNVKRLACYDAAVSGAKKAESEGEFTTITRKEAETVQKEAFGFSLPSLPKMTLPTFGRNSDDKTVKTDNDGRIAEVELVITSIYSDGYGKTVVKFENGQVWQQTDSDKVSFSKKRPPKTAVIKRGLFDSYLIRLDNNSRFKAKRIE
jgi:hypothetical protein